LDKRRKSALGAPRIHGELLKLGFEVAQSSVAKYMVKRRGPPSQGWRTFLRNHAPDIAAMDLFVVPTIGFDLLYAFVIVRLDRRGLVWINVTANPTAEWVARQMTEVFPWDEAPHYLIRDRDRIYGSVVTRRLRTMGNRKAKITAGWSSLQFGPYAAQRLPARRQHHRRTLIDRPCDRPMNADSVGSERVRTHPPHRASPAWWLANDDPTEPSFRIGFGEESCPQMVLSATEQMMRRSA
jgi:hypothetical protein